MIEKLKVIAYLNSAKITDVVHELFERNDLVFTSVDHWTSKDGDEMIQLRLQKVKEPNRMMESDGEKVDSNEAEINGKQGLYDLQIETELDSEEDPDCSRYLDDLYRHISNGLLNFNGEDQKRRPSDDLWLDTRRNDEENSNSQLERWTSLKNLQLLSRRRKSSEV